ncbi:MAG TPA: DMT family transporter [Actinomycetota bacterium]|nr:DMT family transporter [Actinomycetota bacterium]
MDLRSSDGARVDRGLLLILTPVLWGATFPAAKLALDTLTPLALMTWTRGLGLVTLLLVLPWAARSQRIRRLELRALIVPGLGLGGLLFAGYTLQTVGLRYTTATNAGFITGLYVVITPLLGAVLFREMPRRSLWIAVALSVAGLALLSTSSLVSFTPHSGDLLVLLGAFAWAGHVVALGRLARAYPTLLLAAAQLAGATLLHAAATIPVGFEVGDALGIVPLLIVTGVLGTGVAYTLQIVAQQDLSAARTAVILSGESLVAALLSVVWIGERLFAHQWLGAALILGAMVLSETSARRGAAAPAVP